MKWKTKSGGKEVINATFKTGDEDPLGNGVKPEGLVQLWSTDANSTHHNFATSLKRTVIPKMD